MRNRNEKFKQRMRMKKERVERLQRFGLITVVLGVSLFWLGATRM